jgi:hypothetical protein
VGPTFEYTQEQADILQERLSQQPDGRLVQNYGYTTPGQDCDPETGVCHPQILVNIPESDLERAGAAISNWLAKGIAGLRSLFRPKLNSEDLRSIRSLEKRLQEHRTKLDEFKRNPDAFDNKGFLKNAPSDAVRQRIINGRINHLEQEIRNFVQQIERLLKGR